MENSNRFIPLLNRKALIPYEEEGGIRRVYSSPHASVLDAQRNQLRSFKNANTESHPFSPRSRCNWSEMLSGHPDFFFFKNLPR